MNYDFLEFTIPEIASGVACRDGSATCLLCKEVFDYGVVYALGGRLFEGRRAALEHVRAVHGSMFRYLLDSQRQLTGVTGHQADVLAKMAAGMGDRSIAEAVYGSSNTSAVRNLRFQLKEREKQAKAYLALMEAFRTERTGAVGQAELNTVQPHTGSSLADERFDSTEKERAAVLKLYFTAEGVLKDFPVREKRKIIVLRQIAGRFEPGRSYSEKEVNALIAYHDFATVRRYLIEYGLLERSQDCSEYRVKER